MTILELYADVDFDQYPQVEPVCLPEFYYLSKSYTNEYTSYGYGYGYGGGSSPAPMSSSSSSQRNEEGADKDLECIVLGYQESPQEKFSVSIFGVALVLLKCFRHNFHIFVCLLLCNYSISHRLRATTHLRTDMASLTLLHTRTNRTSTAALQEGLSFTRCIRTRLSTTATATHPRWTLGKQSITSMLVM